MPNNNETFYDNTNASEYIKIISNDSAFFVHIINELENSSNVLNIILDLKYATNDISIDFLIEKLKQYGNVITLVNNKITGELLTKLQSVSSCTINYDTLSFRDEKQKEDFEKDLTTNILNLPLEKTDRLLEYNNEIFTNGMAKVYLDLIINDYAEYLDENSIERLKDTIIELKEEDSKYLIRTLFSSIIDLPFSPKLGTDINNKLKEALIDISVIDFLKKYSIMPDYSTNYPKEVIFLREKLKDLGSKENEKTLIFKGSIEQVINAISNEPEAFLNEVEQIDTNNFSTLIHNIASLSNNSNKFEEYLLKLSSRVDSKEEALSTINQTISELMPESELSNQTNTLITEYLNQDGLTLSA